jgi:signal transduction histidine kinase
MMMFSAKEKDIKFYYKIDPNIPELVIGDSLRLKQVLINLVSNAIKFTDRGHVLLRITAGHLDESQFKLYFEIVDTSAGIETTKIAELFQPFTQSDSTTLRRLDSTGLGMAISKELIKLMGGEIQVYRKLVGSIYNDELLFFYEGVIRRFNIR